MSQTDSWSDVESSKRSGERLAPNFVIDDKYVIRRLLGQGGSGCVYEAEHAAIGHRVAIKVVHASRMRREENFARFQREAKICGAIRHPHVGQIYDVGALEDGTPFMVMELHEGRSLGAILDESVMPIAAAIEVTRQLLAGLAAVHHAGVVHRDVKPDNAMIVRASSGDLVVKLVDFGISKFVRADIRERALTQKNIIIGSPDYMAPEQLRGHEVDARTDLYAVGVLLYEAVTGSLPFDGESMTDLMVAIMHDPVKPPSELRTDCPPELEHLILKAISRDPADRFQTADDMSRQLARVQRAVRYAADPGLARLQEPMPPRQSRTKRSFRSEAVESTLSFPPLAPVAPGDASEAKNALPAAGTSDAPTAELKLAKRGLSRLQWALLLVGIGCAALVLASRSPDATPASAGADSQRPQAPSASQNETVRAATKPSVGAGAVVAEPSKAGSQSPPALTNAPGLPEATTRQGAAGSAAPPAQRLTAASRARQRNERPSSPTASESSSSDEADRRSVRALLDDAASAFVLGQIPRARSLYQQVLDRQPSQADAWRGLGLTASRMGQRNDALRAFEQYLKLRPGAPDAARIREQIEKLR